MANPLKPPLPRTPVDWLEFPAPGQDPESDEMEQWFRVNLSFMLSNWTCIFGQGCAGHFGVQDSTIDPDVGCCSHGAWFVKEGDLEDTKRMVDLLTEEDMGKVGFDYIKKNGWLIEYKKAGHDPDDPEDLSAKTRVRDGACVFALRSNETEDGRIGCAFHHLGNRIGKTDHVETMPDVCWQAPINRYFDTDRERGIEYTIISQWDAKYWGGEDEDGETDSWMTWWCIDTADAYVSDSSLFRTMERELRLLMGDAAYDEMVRLINERAGNYVNKMPGQVRNDGRPLLPVLVGNRTNRRA